MVVGAGMIGLCALQLVKLQNPKKVIVSDLSAKRLELAKSLGADEVVNCATEDYMQAVERLTGGAMVDVSIEAVGVESTANQSIKVLKFGGKTMWLGMSQKEMTINMQDIVCLARQVIGSFNYTHEEFGEVVDLIVSGKLETGKLLSKVVSLKDGPNAFALLHDQPDDY